MNDNDPSEAARRTAIVNDARRMLAEVMATEGAPGTSIARLQDVGQSIMQTMAWLAAHADLAEQRAGQLKAEKMTTGGDVG